MRAAQIEREFAVLRSERMAAIVAMRWRRRNDPENSGSFSVKASRSVARLERLENRKDHIAIGQHDPPRDEPA
jgi:hypothetical protein